MKDGFVTYLAVALMFTLTSCQQLSRHALKGDVVAAVNDTSLTCEEVRSVIPAYLSGEDSLQFAEQYVERWVRRQVKVEEAERIFSSSVHDVEMMVNNYRQTLMTQRLDQYYINSASELQVDQRDVQRYYNTHNDGFRLKHHIVKGRILRMPLSYADESKLKSLMSSSSSDSRLNLISMSEKSEKFELEEMTDGWVDYDEFLGKLPIVRDDKSRVYMTRSGVQTLQDSEWSYLFEITAYRSAGYVAPLEMVEQTIRQILTSDLQTQMIRSKEEQLYRVANEQGTVYNRLFEGSKRVAKDGEIENEKYED